MKLGSVRLRQYGLVGGAAILVVLLLLASKVPNSEEAVRDQNVKIRIEEAVAKVQGANPMQGITELRALEKEFPENIRVQWHLAEFSVMSDQLDKAVSRYNKVIELDTSNQWSEAWFRLGELYERMGDVPAAVAAYETFVQRTSNDERKALAQQQLERLKN